MATPQRHKNTAFSQSMRKLFLSLSAPQPKELIDALQSLDNAPSSNAAKRAEIVNLPQKFNDPKSVDEIRNTQEAADYAEELYNAIGLVEDYNARLHKELKKRQTLATMLDAFQEAEVERIAILKEKLVDSRKQLQLATNLLREVKQHKAALPDLKKLSDMMTLTPLPNIQDLFNKHGDGK